MRTYKDFPYNFLVAFSILFDFQIMCNFLPKKGLHKKKNNEAAPSNNCLAIFFYGWWHSIGIRVHLTGYTRCNGTNWLRYDKVNETRKILFIYTYIHTYVHVTCVLVALYYEITENKRSWSSCWMFYMWPPDFDKNQEILFTYAHTHTLYN